MKTKKILIIIFGILTLGLGIVALKSDDRNFEISKQLNIYATLFRDINMLYVDEIKPEDLVTESINAMLNSLDPYTIYYPESQTEDVKLMTTGEYAGIGAVISKRGEGIIIREPYKDSPADKAGLLPGEIIISIDGKTIKAEFTQIKKVDILKLTEYSAEFEVSDEKAVKIVLVGENKITPEAIDLIDKKGSIKSLLVDYTVTKIGVKAVNKNGEKVGESIEVELK